MNTHALEQYPPYIVKKLKKVFEEQSLEHLCSYVEVGDTPYIISLSPHVFKRVREQLDIHDRKFFLAELVSIIEKNKSAGEIIDLSLDEEPVDSSYHKVCLYVEYYDWFVYFHVFDCGILNVATVVSGKDIYYADQQATTLAILENGDVVVGIENIANVQISLNTKLNRTTRERERSA